MQSCIYSYAPRKSSSTLLNAMAALPEKQTSVTMATIPVSSPPQNQVVSEAEKTSPAPDTRSYSHTRNTGTYTEVLYTLGTDALRLSCGDH